MADDSLTDDLIAGLGGLGALVAGPIDAKTGVAALAGVVGPAVMKRTADAIRRETANRRSEALAIVERITDKSREQLLEEIADDPRLVPLFVRVMVASATNGSEKTLRVLATYLGKAVGDRSKIDDVALMLSAVENLSEHHIRILEVVEHPPEYDAKSGHPAATRWNTGLLVKNSGMYAESTHW